MGTKGDKLTQNSIENAEWLLEKLTVIKGISSKKMFGGHGIFHENRMFGMVDSKGQIFFKTNETTSVEYLDKGAIKHGRMPYYSLPHELLDDHESLVEWARQAIEISK